MTVRQRWWIDAAVVLAAVVVGGLLWATHSAIAFVAPAFTAFAVAGITWGRRRWPPPNVR